MTAVTLSRAGPVELTVPAPPSKSLTHRALVAAALAQGCSLIQDPLLSDDTRLTCDGLSRLGVRIRYRDGSFVVEGDGVLPGSGEVLDLGNSGTSLRLLASVAALGRSPVTLTGSARMQQRPVGPLGDALARLGARVRYAARPGCPPVEVTGPLRGGSVSVDGSVSSQFVSSLMLATRQLALTSQEHAQ